MQKRLCVVLGAGVCLAFAALAPASGDPRGAGGASAACEESDRLLLPQRIASNSSSSDHRLFPLADFNGDGIDDVIPTRDEWDGDEFVYFGTPGGEFVQGPAVLRPVPSGEVVQAIAADIDNDGHQDVILIRDSHYFETLFGNGDGTFVGGQVNNRPAGVHLFPGLLSAGDINADGWVDLAIDVYDPTEYGIGIYLNDGAGELVFDTIVPTGSEANAQIADIDQDGDGDLLYYGWGVGMMYVPRLADGTWGVAQAIADTGSPSTRTLGFNLTDVDMDGVRDLVIASATPDDVRLCRGLTPTTFAPTETLLAFDDAQISGVHVGNFTPDALPDIQTIVVRNDDGRATLRLLEQEPGGAFDSSREFGCYAGYSAVGMQVTDFNADGLDDVLVFGSVLEAYRTGPDEGPAAHRVFETGFADLDLDDNASASADIDGDGVPELIMLAEGPDSDGFSGVWMLDRGAGGGHGEAVPVHIREGWHGAGVFASDLNADGHTDLVAEWRRALPGQALEIEVGVILNDGSALADPVYIDAEGTRPRHVCDLNADGLPDLVSFDATLMRPGDGAGGFGPEQAVPGANSASPTRAGSEIADLNGDGLLDVIQTHVVDSPGIGSTFSAYAHLALGDGTFGAPLVIVFNSFSLSEGVGLDAADVNGDGHADILFGTGFPNFRLEYLGNGDGTFYEPAGSALALPFDFSIETIADVNGDGCDDYVGTFERELAFAYGAPDLSLSTQEAHETAAELSGALVADAIGGPALDLILHVDDETTETAQLWITRGVEGCTCPADIDADGDADVDDIETFVPLFIAGSPLADIDADGDTDVDDIEAFVSAFLAGCP